GVLKQVVVNIALSAIEAMPDGGELLVNSRDVGELVVITLRNSGPGIPPGDFERIYEPFVISRTEGGGRGSSLSASFSQIKRLGGQIHLESRPGEGTLYTIELPCQPASANPV
ncbi:MAG TPA: ATP-binding protein, partial [Desulfurivibrionaceae bacterium]|nr:ATP-binding protein [Desulfurivibrionaceae bacterium]